MRHFSSRARRPFIILAVLLLASACRMPAAQAEVIRSFDVALKLQKDTSLDVTETIVMDFENAERHGIYRIIPVRYDRYGGSYTIYLNVVSVTDDQGNSLHYTSTRQGRDLNIKIGDPDRTMTGVHTYRLRYLVRRAVNFFHNAPEVYWNATGNEWPFTIESAVTRFYPPPGVATKDVRTTCFVGPPGSTVPGQVRALDDHIEFSTVNLNPGAGLTIVAGLPAGSVTAPSTLQNLIWFMADWWPLFLFPFLALDFVVVQWLTSGRDVDGGQAVAVEWNPPKSLTPAEVGTLVDERCDMADIISTLIDLAARGYLRIEEIEATKFMFFSSKDYRFVRLPEKFDPAATPLLAHEREFLKGLFGSPLDSANSVLLSSLKNQFYVYLPTIRNDIYDSLTEKRLFARNPDTVRKTYQGLGIAVMILAAVATFMLASVISNVVPYGLGIGVAGAIIFLAARAMPSKTATGSRMLRECLGFQRFVALAEKDRIAVLAKDDPTVFGRMLPYAMVLGVADQWAEKFRDLMTEPPDWYVPYGYGPNYRFSSHSFVNDLGSGMNTMSSTFASAPSSSGSGGSGFSGGGSGGGFGGGGGGSW